MKPKQPTPRAAPSALLLTALRSGIPPQQIRRVIIDSAPKPTRTNHPVAHRARPAPHHAGVGRAPFFFRFRWPRRAPRGRHRPPGGGRKSVAPHLLLAVSGVASVTDRDPVAVNPRPAGSPVLRSAALTAGSRCARAAPAAFSALCQLAPRALRAGLAGPKIRLLLLRRPLRG